MERRGSEFWSAMDSGISTVEFLFPANYLTKYRLEASYLASVCSTDCRCFLCRRRVRTHARLSHVQEVDIYVHKSEAGPSQDKYTTSLPFSVSAYLQATSFVATESHSGIKLKLSLRLTN
jgi:hypothetical protein